MFWCIVVATSTVFGVRSDAATHGLNVAFYNTGQSRYILESVNDISGNNPPTQQTAQLEAIKQESEASELDLWCLSNLLLPKQLNDYKLALNDLYPHSFSQLDVKPESDFATPRTACTTSDFTAFQSADGNCSAEAVQRCDEILRRPETNILDFQICLAQECPLHYEQVLYSECKSCLSIFTEANNVDPDTPGQAIGLATWGCSMPQDRIMNFTDGTLILSKYPIQNTWSVPIPSFVFHEQRLNVVQLDVDGNDVLVGCAEMNPTSYKDNIGSYVAVTEQQRTNELMSHIQLNELQIENMVEVMDGIISDSADAEIKEPTVVLMGDMGVGQTWHEGNFALLTYEGYENYGNGVCTFCVNKEADGIYYNALAAEENNLFDSEVNKDLDHLLLRNGDNNVRVTAWSRLMTQKYTAENSEELPYSSRWGVAMQMEFDAETST